MVKFFSRYTDEGLEVFKLKYIKSSHQRIFSLYQQRMRRLLQSTGLVSLHWMKGKELII